MSAKDYLLLHGLERGGAAASPVIAFMKGDSYTCGSTLHGPYMVRRLDFKHVRQARVTMGAAMPPFAQFR